MNTRIDKRMYLALIPMAAVAMVFSPHVEGLYQRLSFLLMMTASMEAAANGGAIGETLAQP